MSDLTPQRAKMVQEQLIARGINDRLVVEAMKLVPREAFLPLALRNHAYADSALEIGSGQTISQPFVVALMIEALQLRGGERVLEVGTGSGYAAAVLSQIAGRVDTVERIESLAEKAREILKNLDYSNVHVWCGDGSLGWKTPAAYDAILVSAGGPRLPSSLLSELCIGGRLVMPVGSKQDHQQLTLVTRRTQTEFSSEDLAYVRFVPLIGEEGWEPTTLLTPSSHRDA